MLLNRPGDFGNDAFNDLHLRRLPGEVAVFFGPPRIQVAPPVPAAIVVGLDPGIVCAGWDRAGLACFFSLRGARLQGGIDDDHSVAFGPIVVASRYGEIPCVLLAAMQ